jgi:hypothetical protein
LADDGVKHHTEKGPEEVAAKQNKAQGEETDIRAEAVASSQQQSNQTFWFGKPDHPVSPGSVQRGFRRVPCPGQHRLLVGVLQDSRTARAGGSNR